jgi:hypothetical protein
VIFLRKEAGAATRLLRAERRRRASGWGKTLAHQPNKNWAGPQRFGWKHKTKRVLIRNPKWGKDPDKNQLRKWKSQIWYQHKQDVNSKYFKEIW